ncbi:MAG: hypothetical protein IT580_15010 [Verrucomicrobiales bacterium]|nr:hypothetical protein [Verrucomicrobiales bacterium]
MKSFEREDQRFVDTAVDAVRRDAAIGELIGKRRVLFGCAMVLSVCAMVAGLVGGNAASATGLGLAAGVPWILTFKYEAELRMLMIVRRLTAP